MTITTSVQTTDRFSWAAGPVRLEFESGDGPVRLTDILVGGLQRANHDDRTPEQPLVEVLSPRYGRRSNSYRVEGSSIGARMRLVDRREEEDDGVSALVIVQRDEESGLIAESRLEVVGDTPAVRSRTSLRLAAGAAPLDIWSVTSFATGAIIGDAPNEIEVWFARSGWSAENRWEHHPLRALGLIVTDPEARGETSRSRIGISSRSTWSSGDFNPIGAIERRDSGVAMAWQIEHNGAWHWEVGERPDWDRGAVPIERRIRASDPAGPPRGDRSNDAAYLAVTGPNDLEHHWSIRLSGDRTFTTVPVTFTVAASLEDALGALTTHRRAARRDHPQNHSLPVIFNDYMNTLEGDPTEAKLLPLIAAAAAVGAEYFCIDAGWYDDTAGWWASVGDWRPSTARFEHGMAYIVDSIRAAGLLPGLWVEPEVVGVTSQAALELPDVAFLTRNGERIREHDRYFLDLRHPAARQHLDTAIDRLVDDFGIRYFKFDYNVTPGAGSDVATDSVGDALLEHNRALITWLEALLDRQPDVVIENCGSGAMRSDFSMLGALQLQSTSDQQDPLLYPAIAVGALAHILPEQAANWAYPQPEMDDEEIIFAMAAGLAGRLYLSGVLSGMSEAQLALVRTAVDTHNATKHLIAAAIPRYPIGLPTWDDRWIAVAFDAERTHGATILVVWRLSQSDAATEGQAEVTLPLAHYADITPDVEQIFPAPSATEAWRVTAEAGALQITAPSSVASARVFRLRK